MNSIKHFMLIFCIGLLFMTLYCSRTMACTQAEIATFAKETWSIAIIPNVKGIHPAAIQLAIFDENPLELFKNNYNLIKSDGKAGEDENITIMVSWDATFRKITGDQVYLLPSKSRNQFGIASNTPDGPKWLVTKTILQKNGTILCWSIPVEVKKGNTYEIKLDNKNAIQLQELIKQ